MPQPLTVTRLEDRLAPATLTDGGTRVLTITLAPGEVLQVRSTGATEQFFSNNATFVNGGVQAQSFGGLGTNALTLANLARYDGVRIADSGRAAAVDFLDSGANAYAHDFAVTLADPNAGQVRFFGTSSFGTHSVFAATTQGVQVVKRVTATTGSITLSANQQPAARSGKFVGVDIFEGASVDGGGAVTLQGRGGDDAGGSQDGVVLRAGARVAGGAAADTTVTGTGGTDAGQFNYGVLLLGPGAALASGGGAVRLTGTGGGGTGASNQGVVLTSGALVTSGGAGAVSVTGFGGFASSNSGIGVLVNAASVITSGGAGNVAVLGVGGNGPGGQQQGVLVQDVGSRLTSGGGNVSVTGTANGVGPGNVNIGVQVSRGAVLDAQGLGSVFVRGTGGASAGTENNGVRVEGDDQGGTRQSFITSGGGPVTVAGVGVGTANGVSDNQGVHVLNRGTITAGGLGAVVVDGTGGFGARANQGVSVDADPGSGRASLITSSGGPVTVTGRGAATGSALDAGGVFVATGGVVSAGGTGAVKVDGTGGGGVGAYGVQLTGPGSSVTSGGGPVAVVGRGGPGGQSSGVLVQDSAFITAAGTAPVSVDGTGGSGGDTNRGVWVLLNAARITTGGGDLRVTGRGGAGANSEFVLAAAVDGAAIAAAPPGTTTITDATGSAPPPVTPPVIPPVVVPPVVPGVPGGATRVGYPQYAAGSDAGTPPLARLFNPDGTLRQTVAPFAPGTTGGVRVAAADFNGDGVADLVVGTGPGVASLVRVLDGVTGAELFAVAPFEATFLGGVYVAAGDLTGDGVPELVVTPDQGGGPRVEVYNGVGFGLVANFFGIDDPAFRGGARAAVGDVNGDGVGDLAVAAGFGGGPRVAVFDGRTVPGGTPTRLFGDFFAFETTLRNGAFLALGDVNGDGRADIVAGGGPGGGPRVLALDAGALLAGGAQVPLANFFAGDANSRGGVRVAVKNLDNDALADIVVGSGAGAGSRVTAYAGKTIAPAGTPPVLTDLDAFGNPAGAFVG